MHLVPFERRGGINIHIWSPQKRRFASSQYLGYGLSRKNNIHFEQNLVQRGWEPMIIEDSTALKRNQNHIFVQKLHTHIYKNQFKMQSAIDSCKNRLSTSSIEQNAV